MNKVLVSGDVHCKTWIIDKIEKVIDNYDFVAFVGDYVDDWGKKAIDSLETWKKLYDLNHKYLGKVKLVCGNHDYAYIHNVGTASSGYNHMTQFLIDLPENKKLKSWLTSLPVTLTIDGVTYSHAGITKSWNKQYDSESLWRDDSPIWARPDSCEYAKIKQVFGHNPQQTCNELEKDIWCIDTHSTLSNGTNIGDNSLLEIVDGEVFKKIKP